MKPLRRFCAALAFTLMLTLPAYAGWISTGVASPTPSQTPMAAPGAETTTDGSIHAPKNEEASAADSVTELALSLLQNVLSLF